MKFSKHSMLLYGTLMGVLSMCFFSSCTQDLDWDISGFTSKIGVNSIFAPDSVWRVKIYKTKHISETAPTDFIENAEVTITDVKSNVSFQLDYSENGVYVDQYNRQPVYGRSYKIDVDVEGYRSVSADAIVPSPVQVSLIEKEESDIDRNFEVLVHDNPAEENFYILEFDMIKRENGNGPISNGEEDLEIEGGNFNSTNDKPKNLEIFLEDTDLGNNDGTYTIPLNSNEIDAIVPNENEEVKYLIKVRSVSKDLYFYLESRKEYFRNNGNTSLDDPTPIHSNIENGDGIFGALNEQVFEL